MEFNLQKQINTIEEYNEWVRFLDTQDKSVLIDIIIGQMTKNNAFMDQIYENLVPVEMEPLTIILEFQQKIQNICLGNQPDVNCILERCRDIFMTAGKIEKLQDKMYLMVQVIKCIDQAIQSTEAFADDDWLLYESMDIAEENMCMYMDMDFTSLSQEEQNNLISWLQKEAQEYSPSDGDNRIANILKM